MMICPACGSQAPEGASVCPACGLSLSSSEHSDLENDPSDSEDAASGTGRLAVIGQVLTVVGAVAAAALFFFRWIDVTGGSGFDLVRDVLRETGYFKDSPRFYLEFVFLALGPVLALAALVMVAANRTIEGRLLPFLRVMAGIVGLAPLLVFADLGVGLTGPPLAPLTWQFGGSLLGHLAIAVGSGLELLER